MAHFSVVQAVEARLKANWTHCPIRVENDAEGAPEDGGPFLKLQFPWCRSEWQSIDGPEGSDFLEEGAFRFVLSVGAGAGVHEVRPWMDSLANVFRGVQFNGVQTFAPGSPITDDRNDVAGVFRLSFSVPYEFIITHQEA